MKSITSILSAFALGLVSAPLAPLFWGPGDSAAPEVDVAVEFSRSLQRVATKAMPAVVSIEGTLRHRGGGTSSGSGVIVREDGIVVTNNHVVARSGDFLVTLSDGTKRRAKLLGTDPDTDLAVLDIDGEEFTPLAMSELRSPEVGTVVLAIGNPYGFDHTVTSGIISARGRELDMNAYEDFLQTDAAINPGNSGGALVDLQGRLVGINTAVERQTVGNQGLGFAIPTRMVVDVLDGILSMGYVQRGFLGVRVEDTQTEIEGLSEREFAFVQRVVEDSPADRAGIQYADLILAIDDVPVRSRREVLATIASIKPGSEIAVEVWRAGQRLRLEVELNERDIPR